MTGYRPLMCAPATASDAVEADPDIIDEDVELLETVEVTADQLQLMQTIVNQLVVTDLFLALLVGCICAGIFSRYVRG